MNTRLSAILALGLGLVVSPALASDWEVEFTNKSGATVWVVGLDGKRAEVDNGDTHKVKWSERDGCPVSWATAYFIVYDKEEAEKEDAIVTANYKYLDKDKCHLQYSASIWEGDYGSTYETVDKDHGGTTHTRKLTLKPKDD
jgi:hypothetical protein